MQRHEPVPAFCGAAERKRFFQVKRAGAVETAPCGRPSEGQPQGVAPTKQRTNAFPTAAKKAVDVAIGRIRFRYRSR